MSIIIMKKTTSQSSWTSVSNNGNFVHFSYLREIINDVLSEKMNMHIPDPDEFKSSISLLLDSVHTTSILYNISHSGSGKSSQHDILLPAPLFYRYDLEEWWSVNTKQKYDSLIPWYRQSRNWPIYPILNDILVIELRKKVAHSFCIIKSKHKISIIF